MIVVRARALAIAACLVATALAPNVVSARPSIVLTAAAASFLAQCAPNVAQRTMAGLFEVESGWHQYAIGDNTTHQSYFPTSYWDAVTLAKKLRSAGDNLDAGLGQINDSNWSAYGLDEYSVFEPCRNAHVSASILGDAYARAHVSFADGEQGLIHALSAYNSGNWYASLGYADAVISQAQSVGFLQDAASPAPTRDRRSPAPPSARSSTHLATATSAAASSLRVRTPRRALPAKAAATAPPRATASTQLILTWAIPEKRR
jgi:type IV secretion system protein VirB1